jgi:hypothetical protein
MFALAADVRPSQTVAAAAAAASANVFHSAAALSASAHSSNTLVIGSPFHPDVRLKHLPFYDVRMELLKPSSLCESALDK